MHRDGECPGYLWTCTITHAVERCGGILHPRTGKYLDAGLAIAVTYFADYTGSYGMKPSSVVVAVVAVRRVLLARSGGT
jgi:hypothetical protein